MDTEGFSSDAVAEEYSLENDPEQQQRRRQPSKTKLALLSPRLGVLNNIPFVIPFEQRVEIFRMFVQNDRSRNNLDFFIRPAAEVTIRRDHVFEDGFDHLYSLGKRERKSWLFVLRMTTCIKCNKGEYKKGIIKKKRVLTDFSFLLLICCIGADLKKRISIGFVDEFGLQEAGIDGGGVFKEFLTRYII